MLRSWTIFGKLRLLGISLFITAVVAFLAACGTATTERGNSEQPGQDVDPTPAPLETQPPPDLEGPVTDALTTFEDALRAIHERVGASVVNVQVIGALPEWVRGDQGPIGAGSGFVWDTDGHIVTNDHVIAGATVINVTFSDGLSAPAQVVGRDADSDLAVIRVDVPAERLSPVELVDFAEVSVGQIAVAIGNPFGLDGTMTMGIVSGLGRLLPVRAEGAGAGFYSIPDVVQTDASVNPGNSGGVLVDIRGRLIGVPSAMIAQGDGPTGIGFAIPSAIVAQVVPVLIAEGEYRHPWLGVQVTSMSPSIAAEMDLPRDQLGALVVQVTPGSPADTSGLRGGTRLAFVDGQEIEVGGDVIVAIDGEEVRDTSELITYQARHTRPGDTVTLAILRDTEEMEVEVTMGERP